MSPSFAASRKQVRHIPKSRMNARLRPQRKQRRTTLEANFGGLFDRAIVDVFAIVFWCLFSPYFLGPFSSISKEKCPLGGFQNIRDTNSEVKPATAAGYDTTS